ncbi:MAG: dolichyl-phosphate beta-glucosyltransferase [Candidatus Micrarchaeia archaeon]
MVEYSIVLPAHNEEKRLGKAVAALLTSLGKKYDYEIIIAEDGSTDETYQLAKKIARNQRHKVRVIHSDEKLGRGRALCKTFNKAKGKYVAYMDVDLATDVEHVRELLRKIKNADIVVGSRYLKESRAKRTTKRLFFSSGFNLLARLLLGSKISDHQCGFKAFNKKAILPLCKQAKSTHWFWDTEILVLAQKKGLSVEEFAIAWSEQPTTTINFKTDILDMGSGILRLWWKLATTSKK